MFQVVQLEVLIGRSLAVAAHPVLAWRLAGPAGRVLIVSGYFGASYLAALTMLLAITGH